LPCGLTSPVSGNACCRLRREEVTVPGMTSTIRIGVPTAADPEGATGPGIWWMTGSARPGLMPTSQRRAIRRAKRAGRRLANRRRRG
jgi:hypothetical protein